MAELGYTKIDVYDLTIGEIIALREAVIMKHSREWEMHRFVGYMVAGSNPYRKGRLPQIHNFLPLISDRERYQSEISEREARHKLFGSYYKQYAERWKN